MRRHGDMRRLLPIHEVVHHCSLFFNKLLRERLHHELSIETTTGAGRDGTLCPRCRNANNTWGDRDGGGDDEFDGGGITTLAVGAGATDAGGCGGKPDASSTVKTVANIRTATRHMALIMANQTCSTKTSNIRDPEAVLKFAALVPHATWDVCVVSPRPK